MNKLALAIIPLFALILAGCGEIFEKDIEDETVEIIAPKSGTETDLQTVQFWWEEIDGADEYDFQLAYPDFVNPSQLVIDSTVSENLVTFTIAPGFSYTWRVKAKNSAHETEWTEATLMVDSALSCVDQIVLLGAPVDNFATTDTVVFFDWDALSCANEYEWEAIDASGATVAGPWLVSTDSVTLEVPEGKLTWSVKAIADQTSTLPSTFTLYVDLTAPVLPTLNAPLNNDTSTTGSLQTFTWTSEVTDNSPITDSFELWPDSLQSSPYYQTTTDTETAAQDSLLAGTYFWRVKSVDLAGNERDCTATRKLVID